MAFVNDAWWDGSSSAFPGGPCDCLAGGVIAKPPEERHEDRWFDGVSHHLIVEPAPDRHEELGDARSLVEEVARLHDPGAATLGRQLAWELESGEPALPLSVEGLTLELLARLRRGGRETGG